MTTPTALPYKIGNEKLIKVTGAASAKLNTLLSRQGRPGGALRVAVIGGGARVCSTKWTWWMVLWHGTLWSRAQESV